MPISIDEIDIDSNGFYTPDSRKAYLNFCTWRKNQRENWIKAEQDRIECQRKQAEEARKRAEQ